MYFEEIRKCTWMMVEVLDEEVHHSSNDQVKTRQSP